MFQAAMSCFTFFYVGTPDGQTLFCDGCRETKLEKKKMMKEAVSCRNARKPNSFFRNQHTNLLITSDSRNGLWLLQFC